MKMIGFEYTFKWWIEWRGSVGNVSFYEDRMVIASEIVMIFFCGDWLLGMLEIEDTKPSGEPPVQILKKHCILQSNSSSSTAGGAAAVAG